MKRDTGGPAFPRPGYYPDMENTAREDFNEKFAHRSEPQEGMQLRDYFAAAALTGTLAYQGHGARQITPQEAAMEAYAMADAMLAERSRKDSP